MPHKFEAGTPHIAGGIGLGAAIDFVNSIGLENIARHEAELLEHGTRLLSKIPGVRIVGTAREKAGVISFIVENPPMAALDVGMRLDADGHRRANRPPLLPAGDGPVEDRRDRASLIRDVQHERRNRITGLIPAADRRRRICPEANRPPRQRPSNYPTPEAAANELIETFDFLEDWEQRYELLNDLGEKLAPMPDELKTEANLVHGCQSIVYLSARKRPGTPDTIDFLASSNAIIVRGLVALLLRVYSGQSAKAILAFDDKAFIQRLGLDKHTTMFRRTGLDGMIKRICAEATAGELVGNTFLHR